MSNWAYVILCFALTWAVILGYALLTHRRLRQAEAALRAAFEAEAAAGDGQGAMETVSLTMVEVAR
jgi:hypothetical protein